MSNNKLLVSNSAHYRKLTTK